MRFPALRRMSGVYIWQRTGVIYLILNLALLSTFSHHKKQNASRNLQSFGHINNASMWFPHKSVECQFSKLDFLWEIFIDSDESAVIKNVSLKNI